VAARVALPLAATGGLVALSLAGPAMSAAPAVAAHSSTVRVQPDLGSPVGAAKLKTLTSPLPTSQCQTQLGISCYSPLQYRVAYDLNPLYAKGITGAGKTIVIVDSFGSPTIQNDLNTFDAQWGLPSASLTIDKFGNVPPFDPTNSVMIGWAQETTLDVG